MKSFSERRGLKPTQEIIQVNEMSDALRASLWNTLHVVVWDSADFMHGSYHSRAKMERFSSLLWFHYFKQPVDERPGLGYSNRSQLILEEIRKYFFRASWNEVYDFLEFVVHIWKEETPGLVQYLNHILTRELSAYRFVEDKLVDIANEQELDMLEQALADTRFAAVTAHLRRALELLADREQPDYRNSIKESISAVEAMAKVASGNGKATLGEALKLLEKHGRLHQALKDGFLKLYGYTNDEHGIRHAMLEVPDLNQADAKYFLLSCTSFVNYLKSALAA